MTPEFDPTEIIACAIRPAGSLAHLSALVGFVLMCWFVSRSRNRLTRRPR